MPLELVTLIFGTTDSGNLKFLSMLKMVRLLRLGRMITFLKANQKLKFSMKIGQLVFFILIINHWINWLWYVVTEDDESWFPPKDLDFKETNAFSAEPFTRYVLFYYYAILILVGNEILPTDNIELVVITFLTFAGTIFIGLVIGEFASLLAAMTKKDRAKSDEIDDISTVMLNLCLPESVQDRVHEYYDEVTEATYIKNSLVYEMISPQLADMVKLFQLKTTIVGLPFLNQNNVRQIESFCRNIELSFHLPGEIVVKQGTQNDSFYYVVKGFVEIILEHHNFDYFDHKKVKRFMTHQKYKQKRNPKTNENESCSDDSSFDIQREEAKEKITDVFMNAFKTVKLKEETKEINSQNAEIQVQNASSHSHQESKNTPRPIQSSYEESIEGLLVSPLENKNILNTRNGRILPLDCNNEEVHLEKGSSKSTSKNEASNINVSKKTAIYDSDTKTHIKGNPNLHIISISTKIIQPVRTQHGDRTSGNGP